METNEVNYFKVQAEDMAKLIELQKLMAVGSTPTLSRQLAQKLDDVIAKATPVVLH